MLHDFYVISYFQNAFQSYIGICNDFEKRYTAQCTLKFKPSTFHKYFIIAMKVYLSLIIFNMFGVKTQSMSLVETFLHADLNHVILCSEDSTDDTLEYLLNIINRKNIWIYYWNCAREEIPPIHNGLMILNNVVPEIFKKNTQTS